MPPPPTVKPPPPSMGGGLNGQGGIWRPLLSALFLGITAGLTLWKVVAYPSPSSSSPLGGGEQHPGSDPPGLRGGSKRIVRFVLLSDTHGYHRDLGPLPSGDILVHAGDFTKFGDRAMGADFNDWLGGLPGFEGGKYVVMGNHEGHAGRYENFLDEPYALWRGVLGNATLLHDSGAEALGLRLYGQPWQPQYSDTGFFLGEGAVAEKRRMIPPGVDVLITHSPPEGVLDADTFRGKHGCTKAGGCTCQALRTALEDRLQPRLHVFGHLHEGRGLMEEAPKGYKGGGVVSANAAVVMAMDGGITHGPHVVDIGLDPK